MRKIFVIVTLLSMYLLYSGWVYTSGTASLRVMPDAAVKGKQIWQEKNCQNCHQIFGLGGYMGPDLTTVVSDRYRGRMYAKGMLMNGGSRMPNFHFSEQQVTELIAYLDYVNSIGNTKIHNN